MQMADRSCTVESRDRVMVVTINRPERRNALHRFANHEMGDIFDEFVRDPEHWVAILTGEGSQAFCAGADLKD
jgi:enoyl-CoA hydratase/carnithine racemase